VKKSEIEELREYRRLKASGRMIIIPEGFDDGDTVWFVGLDGRISSHMIIEWVILTGRLFGKIAVSQEDRDGNSYDCDYFFFSPEDIGVQVFKTKEEAEATQITVTIDDDETMSENDENGEEDVSDNR
jgi:hypothetical protein